MIKRKTETAVKISEEKIVFLNGTFILHSQAKISPFDHGFLFGDGVYETLLIMNGEISNFEAHYIRLLSSAKALGLELPFYADSSQKIKILLQTLIEKNQKILSSSRHQGRVRITLSRGENNFDFTSSPFPTFLLSLSPLPKYPEQYFQQGISLKTLSLERSYPEIKSINFLASLMGRREIAKTGEYEAIFITQKGFFREGSVSNILAFHKEKKEIWIAPHKTVLAGTMQEKICEKLQKKGFNTISRNFTFEDIQKEKMEVIISNSLFGAFPVQSIDGKNLASQEFTIFKQYIGKNILSESCLSKSSREGE